jgi:2-polyprenyl-3-methyl-5-hydroxy-6-metoxy-1,4-benzoquinol methylase
LMRFSARSSADEWMDAPGIDQANLARCLDDLAVVNSVTLARPPTMGFVRRVARLQRARGQSGLSVLDVGYGQGDMLRRIARWGARRGLSLQLSGVDLSPASKVAAEAATPDWMGITYRTRDVFDEAPASVDVIVSSLFTHHLSDAEVVRFLHWMERTARVGWFINDLHRHPLAYYGFKALSGVAGWHPMVRHDGPVSVARSFQRRDWVRLLAEAGLEARVRWHVPFRYCVGRLK